MSGLVPPQSQDALKPQQGSEDRPKKVLKPIPKGSSFTLIGSSSPPLTSSIPMSRSSEKRKAAIEISSDPVEEGEELTPQPAKKLKRDSPFQKPTQPPRIKPRPVPRPRGGVFQGKGKMDSDEDSAMAEVYADLMAAGKMENDEESAIAKVYADLMAANKMTDEIAKSLEQKIAQEFPKPKPVVLSEEQQRIMSLVQSGQNVFFTGSAGVGKSILLREIIATLKAKLGPDCVAVTASTGMAATNIGGCTLHSFAGLGLAKESNEKLFGKLVSKNGTKARHRWLRTKVLIIDEISMVDGRFFEKLQWIANQIRKQPTGTFGGIQLIVCGDFFQLPPVPENGASQFAFNAYSWSKCFPQVYCLRTVFRQSDQRFVDILNEMRLGTVSQNAIDVFKSLERKVVYDDGIEPTHLMAKRDEVKSTNMTKLQSLAGELVTFESEDIPSVPKPDKRRLSQEDAVKRLDRVRSMLERDEINRNKDTLAEPSLSLKVGAQVMCIKNLTEPGIVNGSLGTVVGICTAGEVLQVSAKIGQQIMIGAVAPKDKDKQKKLPFSDGSSPEDDADQIEGSWPVVKFALGGSQQGMFKTLFMPPLEFSVEDADGDVEAVRWQTPLILSWALTIHKAQGQTLQRVKVDLSSVFEKGQAYVAISRAVSLDNLEVRGFRKDKIMAHGTVLSWAKKLI